MNIHRIKGKRKSPIFAPVFNKLSREYLSDLTIRVVKEKTLKPEGLTPLRHCTRSGKMDDAYLSSAYL